MRRGRVVSMRLHSDARHMSATLRSSSDASHTSPLRLGWGSMHMVAKRASMS